MTLGGILKKCTTTDDKAKPEVDELEEYLAMPLEDTDIVLLDWWKNHEYRFPKLAKMAKQYLAAPASTAGVERVFSAAGRMHNDLRKSMKDSTLEHSLFARFNTPFEHSLLRLRIASGCTSSCRPCCVEVQVQDLVNR